MMPIDVHYLKALTIIVCNKVLTINHVDGRVNHSKSVDLTQFIKR
jgi:hypothetical protein